MEQLFAEKLGYTEVKYKVILIPKRYRGLFPPPLQPFDIEERDGMGVYTVHLDSQYRFHFTKWFNHHPSVREGDEVTFLEENGRYVIEHQSARGSSGGELPIHSLVGKVTSKGKIVGIKYIKGKVLLEVQQIKEYPIDDILDELR